MFRWARIGEDLDLLDAPGILPMKLRDQAAAIRLAICHDIGESSYAVAGVAAVFVEILKRLPSAGKLSYMFAQFTGDEIVFLILSLQVWFSGLLTDC